MYILHFSPQKMANEAVFKYLVDTNRPYSCADVTVNLRGAFTKGAVQKALDGLSESGRIRCKLYGKQKVYAAVQPDAAVGEADVEDYEQKLKSLTEKLSETSNSLKTAEADLKSLTSAPTTDTAQIQIENFKKSIETIENKLETLKTSTEVVSADEKKKILDEHNKLVKEYRKRKRICSEMIEAVMEGYPKSKKNFLEELCLETDEMVAFTLMTN